MPDALHLTSDEVCLEIAAAAFVDAHHPNYRPGIFGPVSPTGEIKTPFRPTQLTACLGFVLEAAAGTKNLPEATQIAVDDYVDLLIAARESRNG